MIENFSKLKDYVQWATTHPEFLNCKKTCSDYGKRIKENYEAKNYAEALEIGKKFSQLPWSHVYLNFCYIADDHHTTISIHLTLAACEALLDRPDDAMKRLLLIGDECKHYTHPKYMLEDKDFTILRGRKDFVDLVDRLSAL